MQDNSKNILLFLCLVNVQDYFFYNSPDEMYNLAARNINGINNKYLALLKSQYQHPPYQPQFEGTKGTYLFAFGVTSK